MKYEILAVNSNFLPNWHIKLLGEDKLMCITIPLSNHKIKYAAAHILIKTTQHHVLSDLPVSKDNLSLKFLLLTSKRFPFNLPTLSEIQYLRTREPLRSKRVMI